MQLLRKYSSRYLVWIVPFLGGSTAVHAQNGGQVRALAVLDGSQHQIKPDSSVTVQDSTFFDPANAGKIDSTYGVQDQVTLMINEASTLLLRTPFSVTVTMRISYTDTKGDTASTIRNFTVGYDTARATTYNSRSSFVFNGAHKVTVTVLSDSSNVATWDPTSVLLIEDQLTTTPVFVFDCSNTVSNITVSPSSDPTADELPVSWNVVQGADQYDLEWTWVDSSALDTTQGIKRFGSPYDPTLIFRNSSTRITTTGTSYNIPIIYDNTGTLFIRVRPVQTGQGYAVTNAIWSSDASPSVMGQYTFRGHERPLNWQSNISFAEEGKRKVVVQYYDGSLRSRQTVTKDNTTNTTIVAETYYDYQGRPAIQVMPAPTLNTIIKYTAGFNISYNAEPYSQSNYDTLPNPALFCSIHADSMSNDSGAARYYSPSNPVATAGLNQFIPDAHHYPFTETEYTPDNTGRINRQGGVGPYHQLGSGHETKYFYGTPDQAELDALFGTEVGDRSHYFKNMVRDANGQYSVSYVDMHGRTIATALAGVQPLGMAALPSNTSRTITETLADSNSVFIRGQSMISQKSLLVPMADTFTFNYSLTPDVLNQNNCQSSNICYTCRYDLNITITDNCNNQLLGGQPFSISRQNFSLASLRNSCVDTATTLSFSLLLPEGSYTITKTLTVDPDVFNFYRDSIFLPNNTCTTIGQYISQQTAVAESANSSCAPSCAACLSSVGSWSTFLADYNAALGLGPTDTTYQTEANAAYQAALSACSSLCQTTTAADDIQTAMLQDMTPPYGQYADTAKAENADKYSIFYTPDSNDYVPLYKLPQIIYLDVNGKPDSVFNPNSGIMVDPNSLSPSEFVQNFRPSWANALLPYHPEYCKLVVMQNNRASLLYDRKMESIDTYQEALDSGFLNPTGMSSISSQFPIDTYNVDPLSSTLGSQLNSKLLNFQKLSNPNLTLNLWELASVMVKCDSGDAACVMDYNSTGATFSSSWCQGDLDMAWKNFRELYLGAKQEIFYQNLLSDQAMKNQTVCTPANSRQYTTTPKLSQLYSTHHQPEFSDLATSMTNTAMVPYYSTEPNPTSAAQQVAYANASLDSLYNSVCNAYTSQWRQQMSGCTVYNPDSVTDVILPALDTICRHACDSAHPYGASTLPPGQTVLFEGVYCASFQDVINRYNSQHSITDTLDCNAEVINSPLPYGNQPVYSNKPIYTRPSDCECSLINGFYNQFTLSTYGDTSFSAFLLRTQQISMTAADLTTLRNMCDTAAGSLSCKNLSTPIYLPPAMQCYSGAGCARCQTIDSLYTLYKSQYPSDTPSITSDADTLQVQKNILFQNYMNNRLGFNLQTSDYLQFIDTCSVHAADTTTTVSCAPPPTVIGTEMSTAPYSAFLWNTGKRPDGSYYVCGNAGVLNSIRYLGYVARYNNSGNVLWAKTYADNTDSSVQFRSIRPTSDGGFVTVGSNNVDTTGRGGYAFILRGDSSGHTIWERSIKVPGSVLNASGYDVVQTNDGGFALTTFPILDIVGTYADVIKLDSGGTVLWSRALNTAPNRLMQATNIAVSGDTILLSGMQGNSNDAMDQGFLIKMDGDSGAVFSAIGIQDTAGGQSRYVGQQFGLLNVTPTNSGYKIGVFRTTDSSQGRIAALELSFDGTIQHFRDFEIDSFSAGPSLSTGYALPTSDGGWAEVQGYGSGILFVKLNPDGSVASAIHNPTDVGLTLNVAQNADSSYMVTGSSGFLNVSSSGTIACYDSASDISIASPPITSFPDTLTVDSSLSLVVVDSVLTEASYATSLTEVTCNSNGSVGCYSNYNGPLLCGKSAPLFPPVSDTITVCTDSTFFGNATGTALYNTYSDSLTGAFGQNYLNLCMQAYKHESFTVTHTQSEYHFTLYYYDQSGNLVKTVPPAGVAENTDTTWIKQVDSTRAAGGVLVPSHTLVTNYRYNTLNQVIAQHSPDGKTSTFYYDRLGRLSVSQNRKQALSNAYSYTEYDSIGRIIQVGQLTSSAGITDTISRNDSSLGAWLANAASTANQITATSYDSAAFAIQPQLGQRNMRNRVSWTALFNTAADLANGGQNAQAATYYTYDILGNVDTLLQDFGGGVLHSDVANSMNLTGNRFKKIAYNFDLVSGKVNQIGYQHGNADAFYHSYLYDAENRITNVQSSTDSINWDNDAFYSYYAHGPLSRTVLGQQQVQGINYAYTLQGWLKAINPAPDTSGSFTLRPDSSGNVVANTAYNLLLDYFNGDYTPISAVAGPDSAVSTILGGDYRPLYNGNISSMGANVRGLSNPILYNYQYDQLNRLVHMDAWYRDSTPWSAISKSTDFQEGVAYDPNGNITKYRRNGSTSTSSLAMDSLNYSYLSGTNQLDHITDSVTSWCSTCNDITSQSAGNYQYDSIGELTADAAAGISSITWTVYGKIASISKPAHDSTILFTYDAGGNRISKSIIHAGDTLTTWYVRDAQGTILSVYTYGDPSTNGKDLTQTELDVYGSSRLGIWKRGADVEATPPSDSVSIPLLGYGDSLIFTRGNKLFELTNHLGNVLSTISDKRYGVSTDDSTVVYFNPDVVSANDYYPFGMLEPGRQYAQSMLGSYRYGFNGKEQDNEVKGVGDQIDYGQRGYDPRVGRFLSVDPLIKKFPWYTPYEYAGDKPVWRRDLEGMQVEGEDELEDKERLLDDEEKREAQIKLRNALRTPTPEEQDKDRKAFEDLQKESPEARGSRIRRLITAANYYGRNTFEAAQNVFGGNRLTEAIRQFDVNQERIRVNQQNGEALEGIVTEALRNTTNGQVARQVTLLVTGQLNGQNVSVRIRIDNITNENGILNLYEAKYSVEQITGGNYIKTLTPNQQTAFDIFVNGTNVNIYARGQNSRAAGIEPGENITGKIGDIKVVTNSTSSPTSQPQIVKKVVLPSSNLQNKRD